MCLPPTYVDFRTEVLDAPLPSVWEGLGTTFGWASWEVLQRLSCRVFSQ